ncbi:MAG: hypothetical protein H8E18_14005 [FCB group bacterium]|nr:hypothetical protein [FCB group bacterium]
MNLNMKEHRFKLSTVLVFVLFTLFSLEVSAYDFVYKETFVCGPKKLKEFEGYKYLGSNRWEYYFFNLSEDGNFVILNDDIQWTSFSDTTLYQIYQQNGGVFTATHTISNGIDIYKLINKSLEPVWIKTVMVDRKSMTYVARVSQGDTTYEPAMGVCVMQN